MFTLKKKSQKWCVKNPNDADRCVEMFRLIINSVTFYVHFIRKIIK